MAAKVKGFMEIWVTLPVGMFEEPMYDDHEWVQRSLYLFMIAYTVHMTQPAHAKTLEVLKNPDHCSFGCEYSLLLGITLSEMRV